MKRNFKRDFTDEQRQSMTRGHNFWKGELQMLKQIADEMDDSRSGALRQLIRKQHAELGLPLPKPSDDF